jgi:hypothetical protein
MIFSKLTNNPIFKQEDIALQHSHPFDRLNWWHKQSNFSRLIVWVRWGVFLYALMIYFMSLAGSLFGISLSRIVYHDLPAAVTVFCLIFIVAEMGAMIFITLSRGVHLINREDRGGRLDMLLLTGLSAREIVRGKWWAAMVSLRPDCLYLALVRTLLGFAMVWWTMNFNGPDMSRPSTLGILMMPGVLFLFSYAMVGVLLAIGLIVSAVVSRPGRATAGAGGLFIALWIALIMLVHFFIMLPAIATYSSGGDLYYFLVSMSFSLLENGTLMSAWLPVPPQIRIGFPEERVILAPLYGMGAALLLYALLIIVLLFIAERLLIRRGAVDATSKIT